MKRREARLVSPDAQHLTGLVLWPALLWAAERASHIMRADLAACQPVDVVEGERCGHGAFSSMEMARKPNRLSSALSPNRSARIGSTPGSAFKLTTKTGR